MAKDNSNSFNDSSSLTKEPDSNKSFVKKVRSRVSELLPSSLSKWFRNDDNNKSTVRQREEDDDEYYDIQPPSKRVKIPTTGTVHNILHTNSIPSTFTNDIGRNHSVINESKQNHIRSPFSEPLAGPSGLQSRKTCSPTISVNYNSTKNLVNGDKDSDSDESTSGYSSMVRIGQKELANCTESKKVNSPMPNVKSSNLFNTSTFGGHSRSLFTERSLSPQMNSSLSSRRPSFSASTFGSPSFVDRTLSTKRITSSPFYSGRTMYGGASAYSFQQGKSPSDLRASMRNQIQVKPVNQPASSDDTTLSKTARRILNALEEYTTPITDAKRIPNPMQKRQRSEGLLSRYTGANPYLIREKMSGPPNKELQIPTVPDLLKMKLKERLQDSTVAVRQIATTSKSALNTDEYKIRTVEEEPPKHSNKMKSKITSTRQRADNNQTVEEVKLPEVSLPITTLPKFDFSLPLPPSSVKPLVTVACNEPKPVEVSSKVPEKVVQKSVAPVDENSTALQVKSDAETVEYKFSNPLVLAENLVSIIAINDFKFSDPVFKKKDKLIPDATKLTAPNFTSPTKLSDISFNFKSSDNAGITLKRKNQNTDVGQPAAKLLSGSVEEMFTKNDKFESLSSLDKFKPAPGMWECSVCMIRNTPDKLKCAACETAKPKAELINKKEEIPKPKSSFGEQFKMSLDKWECNACMVRNSSKDAKCVACTTPKPGTDKPNGPITSVNTFGDKFKPPSSTWECPTCMIRNASELDNCAACETSKPGVSKKLTITGSGSGFGDSFKKKNDEWECSICMVRNSNEKTSCAACETPKPGTTSTKPKMPKDKEEVIPTFNFGIFPANTANKSQDIKSESSQSNKSEKTAVSTTSFIFGSTAPITTASTATSAVPAFSFGIPAKTTNDAVATAIKPKESASEFLFKPAEKVPAPEKPAAPAPSGFLFGAVSTDSSKPSSSDTKLPAINIPVSKSGETLKLPTVSSTGFTFSGSLTQPAKQPDNKSSLPVISTASQKLPETTKIEKPIQATTATSGFTFGTALKRPVNNSEVSPASSIKNNPPLSTSSIIFSPPKQQLVPNNPESNLIKKPSVPLNGNLSQAETNLFSSLSKSSAPTQSLPNSSFTFSSSSQKPSALPTTTSAPSNMFSFGAKATAAPLFGTTTTTTDAPVFKFNVSQSEQPNSQVGFGMSTDMQQPPNTLFGNQNAPSIFGAPAKPAFETPAAPTAPTPPFGSVTPSGFGTTSVSEIKPFTFGARPTEEPPLKTPAFSFGQNSKPTELPKAPAFNFGSSAPPSAPAGGFSFNPNPAPPAPNINFNFGAPKAENPSPFQAPAQPAPSIFGTSAPVQPQPVQNGGFNFGSSATNSSVKTGFNFGATTQLNPAAAAPAPTPGVFSFGASNPNPQQPAPGGFNFGANSTPTFNANVKPTFNFTGGATPTFSAQPAPDSSVMAQRKKIRAVRRTQR